MKNPLLIAGLILLAGAVAIGAVMVLGIQAKRDLHDNGTGLNFPTSFPGQNMPIDPKTTPADLPAVSTTGPWPKAVFDETIYAFGRMAVNSRNEHAFVIRNEGEADLFMKEGQPTCKCTTFSLGSSVLKPGEETKLVIDWKTGPAHEEEFRHGGPVYTNDPKNARINFFVRGEISFPVEVLPNHWSVGNVALGKPGTFQAAIVSRLTDQLEVESVESPSGKVTVKVSPMDIAELKTDGWMTGFRLDVEIAADIPPGRFKEDIKIHLKGVDQFPFLTAELTARKYGSFIVQPLEGAMFFPDKLVLQLGQFPASEGRTAKLMVIVDEKDMTEPFQISDIEADPSFLKASLQPLGTPTGTVHRYTVAISVPPGRPHTRKTDAKRGHITIHTNHPSKEMIQTDVLMYSH